MSKLRAFAIVCVATACGSAPPSAAAPREANSSRSRPSSAPAPDPDPDGFEFSLASYNINFGNGHGAATVETIAALDADIILLQETTHDSEDAVVARLEDEYEEILFHYCCRAGGLAILSRFEIERMEIVPTDIGMFPAMWARIKTPRGPLVVVNVHLHPPISDGGSWVVGFFSTRPIRAREIAALWLDVPKGLPTIVGGDFNEAADGGVMALLSSEGLQASLPPFVGKEPTWHWPVGATELKMQLDHVAFSEPLSPTNAKVVRGGLSDHEPVVVDFVWPDGKPPIRQ